MGRQSYRIDVARLGRAGNREGQVYVNIQVRRKRETDRQTEVTYNDNPSYPRMAQNSVP